MSKRVAICIGVNKHKYTPSANLNFATKDAQRMTSLLRDSSRGEFDEVVELLDQKANKSEVLASMNRVLLNSDLGEEDLALIFFSGHGGLDKADNLYLVPHDFKLLANRQVDISTVISINELQTYLDNSGAGSIIVILDACHSGAAGKLLRRIKYDDSSNVILIGASRLSEKAWEAPKFSQSRFTEFLLRAVNQKPTRGEWITLQQALAFIQLEMRPYKPKQTMEVSSHLIDQSILLFKNPLYSAISETFTNEVKDLCETSNFIIVPERPNKGWPNAFIIREPRSFGRHADTRIICLDNSEVGVTQAHIQQVNLDFQRLQQNGQATSGMIITRYELPLTLKQICDPLIQPQTVDEIRRNLINFDRYLKILVDQFEKGESERAGDPPLKECYIELDAQKAKREQRGWESSQNITDILESWLEDKERPAAIVLGSYGTGKTTLCRKIAYDLAHTYRSSTNKEGLRIPILFSLHRFPKFSRVDIEAFIIAHLKQYCKVHNPDFSAFQLMNNAGLFVLIFDGFDEMAVHADEDIIHRNFAEIARFATAPQAKVLLTSRPEAFLTQREEHEVLSPENNFVLEDRPRFQRIKLESLSEAQIERYLQKRIPLIKEAALQQHDWTDYREKINQIMGLRELARRPVLLEMTIKTFPKLIKQGRAITRPDLYETYLIGEINRQQVGKRRNFLIRKKKRLHFMQVIASFLYTESRQELNASEIRTILQPEFPLNRRGDLEAYLRDFLSCSFLTREGDSYRFSHRSFMEYLVAKVLVSEIQNDSPNIFKRFKLTAAVRDFLVELKPTPDDSWCERLWNWVRRTIGQTKESSMYIGGNAITILHLIKQDLAGLDLRQTVLQGAYLQRADLAQSYFTGSEMSQVDLSNANLGDAKLNDCILEKAIFTEARLINSDFRDSKLIRSNFEKADLTNANFQNADLKSARIGHTRYGSERLNGKPLEEKIKSSALFNGANLEGVEYYFGGSCFLPETQIRMIDGTHKPIEDVKVGERILSYCTETSSFTENQVIERYIGDTSIISIINGQLTTTPSEFIFANEKWIRVRDLQKGDILLHLTKKIIVQTIEHKSKKINTFNLIVHPHHNFFAEGILVHNGGYIWK